MSQVKLSWTAPAGNVEVAGYVVEPGPREYEFCTGRDDHTDELQRHGISRWEDLQLPGPGNECREEPERILKRGECGDRFAYDRSSHIALNEDGGRA